MDRHQTMNGGHMKSRLYSAGSLSLIGVLVAVLSAGKKW